MVGPNTGKSFGGISCTKVSTIAIVILLNLLHKLILLDGYMEKKGPTHRVWLGWDKFSNSVILMHVHIWGVRGAWILLCVSQSEEKNIITSTTIAYGRWWRAVICRIVIGCIDVWWILHFAFYSYVSHWLRDGLPMDTFLEVASHMRVLEDDTND